MDADAADATTDENLDGVITYAKELSGKTGAVIAITGAIDIVADSRGAYVIRNGHPMMSKITGTGCMLTAVIAACCAANPRDTLGAVAAAVCAMGLCGEQAYQKVLETDGGTATLRIALIDAMSRLDGKALMGGARVESR